MNNNFSKLRKLIFLLVMIISSRVFAEDKMVIPLERGKDNKSEEIIYKTDDKMPLKNDFSVIEESSLNEAVKNDSAGGNSTPLEKVNPDSPSLLPKEDLSSIEEKEKADSNEIRGQSPLVGGTEDKSSRDFDLNQSAGSKLTPVVIDGDEVNFFRDEGKVTAKGNVKMKYQDILLSCDEVEYSTKSNLGYLRGNIKIIRDQITVYGKNAVYDFNAKTARIENIRMEDIPYYGAAKEGEKIGEEKYVFKRGYVTTCNLENPHYRLTAKSITIYPQDKVVAKNVILKVGNIPVFYMPYFSHSLKEQHFPAQITGGKSDEWGLFGLSRWRFHYRDKDTEREIHSGYLQWDWYENRDMAGGVTDRVNTDNWGRGLFKYYRIDDKLYDRERRNSLYEFYPERNGISTKDLEDDRYKAQVSYQCDPIENLSVVSEFNKFSDPYFMKDYFYLEDEKEPHPYTYTLMDYSFSNSSLSLFTKKRVNRFSSEVEYLPQLEHNFYRQNIGDSKFYMTSISKLGNVESTNAHSEVENDTFRMHAENILDYSDNIRWLRINPYVGGYESFYSRGVYNDRLWRGDFKTGMDISTKLYKVFNTDFSIFKTKINAARHILTPKVTYGYQHSPTIPGSNLFQFDGVDSLSKSESAVFALDNKLQLKSKEKVWDIIYFSPSLNYLIHQEGKGSYFTAVNTALEVYPTEWISLKAGKTYDIPLRRISSFNLDFVVEDNKSADNTEVKADSKENEESDIDRDWQQRYYFAVGHRYVRQSSSQGTVDLAYKILPKVKVRSYFCHEYNTNDFKEQEYSARIDLHCWWLDFGVNMKRKVSGISDVFVWAMFRIKAFSDMEVGFDRSYYHIRKSYDKKIPF